MRLSEAPHRRWSNRVVAVSSIFAGFGAAHLIDDFLYGVPAEFNLTNPPTQFLALAFFIALTGLIALAARGRRARCGFNFLRYRFDRFRAGNCSGCVVCIAAAWHGPIPSNGRVVDRRALATKVIFVHLDRFVDPQGIDYYGA
jgi:uncharacterized membrane protein